MSSRVPFQILLYFLLLILFSQPIPTSQLLFHVPYIPHGPREPHCLPYKPKKNSTLHIIDLENMSKTLWDADYKIMSLLLKRELPKVVPYGGEVEPPWFKRNPPILELYEPDDPAEKKKLKLYDNNTVTVFAPPDDAFRFEFWMDIEYHIVVSKFDRETIKSGLVFRGLNLPTCDYGAGDVVITDVEEDGGSASINNVKITRWNIYNDGHLIVHGVEDFFDPGFVNKHYMWARDTDESFKVHGKSKHVIKLRVSDML